MSITVFGKGELVGSGVGNATAAVAAVEMGVDDDDDSRV